MAGPVYYADRYPHSSVKFPPYYDGKLFIYEWARSWIIVVSFDEHQHLEKIEPFMPNMPLSKPIDMEFGPDGAMYLLEYGANYFAKNDEARLVKIEYAEGNRAPVSQLAVDKEAGGVPLEVQFSAVNSYDYDEGDSLQYVWIFDGDEIQAKGATASFTIALHLNASDGQQVGEVSIMPTEGNRNFTEVTGELAPTEGIYDLYFVIKKSGEGEQAFIGLDWMYFHASVPASSLP